MNKKQIKNYLIDDIKRSIENDVGIALKAYWQTFNIKKVSAGFFAVPRMLFPEIDGLGSYLTGNSSETSRNIKEYLYDVMGQIDQRYKEYAGFIAVIYRHGLLHQHAPKKFKFKNKEFGWCFSINSPNNPTEIQRRFHLIIKNNCLMIDMNIFYKDVVDSIGIFSNNMLDVSKFKKVFKEQNKKLSRHGLLRGKHKKSCLSNEDFKFLKTI